MPAANLPDKGSACRDNLAEKAAERLPPLLYQRGSLGQAVWPQAYASPALPASMATISRLISVGFTPLIRLACPSVSGFI